MELSERRRRILRHVVEEYVTTAQPVGSELIARRYEPEVSPATIRNDLAALEDLGLITHPHTSAGRVPTDAGYRYFVQFLMPDQDLSPVEQRTIRHQFHQVEHEVSRWAHLASAVLANTVGAAAVATPPASPRARVRRIELLPVQDDVVLLALILPTGAVREQIIHLDQPASRDDLGRLANRLSVEFEGKGPEQVAAAAERATDLEGRVLRATARLLRQAEEQAFAEVYYDGLVYILDQPEFQRSEQLRPIVEVLEREDVLARFLRATLAGEGIQVIIGREHALEQMRGTAAVLTRYGSGDEVVGVLGVLGPTRLAYWRAVPMVRFMAGLLDLLVEGSFH